MININSEKAIITLGNGDVGINTYSIKDRDEKGLVFYNKESKRIGEPTYVNPSDILEHIDNFPVKMVFNSVESINSVISILEELKELMNPNPYDLGHHFTCEHCGDGFDIEDQYTSSREALCQECHTIWRRSSTFTRK